VPSDSSALAQCHNAAFSEEQMTSEAFAQLLEEISVNQGQGWVIEESGLPLGYALATPVPGLDRILDLRGCIDPARHRQGYGSRLLRRVLEELRRSGGCQVSHAVNSLDDPAARFLMNRAFFVEHVELRMLLEPLDRPTMSAFPTGYRLQIFHERKAIGHFLQLYELSFAGRPWYQPYQNEGEVSAELADPADLLFLSHGHNPIGFLWLRWPTVDVAEIEPVGIAPYYQGRGLARPFLQAGIQQAAGQGASKVALGVWENNGTAIRLYQSLGFRQAKNVIYLAFNLGRREAI
jgi:mycothiol synthase